MDTQRVSELVGRDGFRVEVGAIGVPDIAPVERDVRLDDELTGLQNQGGEGETIAGATIADGPSDRVETIGGKAGARRSCVMQRITGIRHIRPGLHRCLEGRRLTEAWAGRVVEPVDVPDVPVGEPART